MDGVGDLIDEIGFDEALALTLKAIGLAQAKPRNNEAPADDAKNA